MSEMNKRRLQNLRGRLFMGGWTEMVEALDFALQYVPRDESVEGGAEREVRAALIGLALPVATVEWLDEDECFEVKFKSDVSRDDLTPTFVVEDVDHDTAWIKPTWEIVK